MSVPYYPGITVTPNLGLSLISVDEVVADNFVLIDAFAGGGGGGSVSVNGSVVDNPNFKDSATATFSVSGSDITITTSGGFTNPMTTLGDLIYENATPAPARLAGNTTSTKKYLSQVGNGTISAVPAWSQVAYVDISGTPQLAQTKAAVTSNFFTAYDAITGLFTAAQPAYTDITGLSTVAHTGAYGDLSGLPALAQTTSRTAHSFFSSYSAITGAFGQSQPAVADLSDTPAANTVLAGPTSGSAATATFRSLVTADIPSSITAGSLTTLGTPAVLLSGVTGFNVLGDSIGSGSGVINKNQVYASLFATSLGKTINSNVAVAGSQMTGFMAQAFAITPSATIGTIAIPGANEIAESVSQSLFIPQYIAAVMDFAVWLGLQPAQVVTTAGMAFSGTWVNFGNYEGLNMRFSHVIGSTATATVSGTVVYVGNFASLSSDFTCSYTVTIDGNVVDTVSGFNTYLTQYPVCKRYAGLSSGSHTVVITSTSSTNVAPIQFIAGNGGASGTTPLVVLGTTIPYNVTSNNTTIASMNSQLTTMLGLLQGDGLNITLVDTNSVMSLTATMPDPYASDNFHPNAVGNLLMANKMLSSTFNGMATGNLYTESVTALWNWALLQPQYVTPNGAPGATGTGFAGELIVDIGGTTLWACYTANNWKSIPLLTYGNTVAQEIATVNLTAQSAAIAATNLVASLPASGMYRISWSADITTASDISSVLGGTAGFQVGYTSPTDSVAKLTVSGNSVTSAANTTGTSVGGGLVVYAKTGTAITYQMDYTDSHTSTAMHYELHIKLEQM